MRTYDEILSSASDSPPFSNGTEGHGWMENWCYAPCHQPDELAWQRYEDGKRKTPPKLSGCPLLLVALLGKTPVEWIDQREQGKPYPIDRYHCIEVRGPDEGGGSGGGTNPPRPRREPKDMDGLFDRPERRTRMLKQQEMVLV